MKITSAKEDSDFIKSLDLGNLLEQAGEYIANNYEPQDIFPREDLVEWALANNFEEKP
jgi:hypothetical protein